MLPIPADIFTEPDVSPDGLANLGPLRRLAGVWQADKGVDINPKAEGPERRVFREHVRMDPIDPQTNGPQLFYGLRYHIHINTPEEKITFHDQVGYWLMGACNRPDHAERDHSAGAGCARIRHCKAGRQNILRHSEAWRHALWNLLNRIPRRSLPHDDYRCDITFNDDGSWTYNLQTRLVVRGREQPFDHHDTNTLKLAAAPTLNPLAASLSVGAE